MAVSSFRRFPPVFRRDQVLRAFTLGSSHDEPHWVFQIVLMFDYVQLRLCKMTHQFPRHTFFFKKITFEEKNIRKGERSFVS